jgi:hypothetical protein
MADGQEKVKTMKYRELASLSGVNRMVRLRAREE